jgi:hypothetical protein
LSFSPNPNGEQGLQGNKRKVKKGELYNNIPSTMLKIRTNKKWAAVSEVGHDYGFNHGC